MKQLSALIALLPFTALAQTTWEVEVGGSTLGPTLPYYEPMELVIAQGDIVHWEAVSGSHNVNGSITMFPDNPVGFVSGSPTSNLDYEFTFDVPGTYSYHCTAEGHSVTQHGMITVQSAQQVDERTDLGHIMLFPVPAEGHLTLELGSTTLKQAEVFGVDGRVMRTVSINGTQRVIVGLEGMATGRYFLRLTDTDGRRLVRPFLKA